jgi:hypothetical protein
MWIVALPAEVSLAVSTEIDTWYLGGAVGVSRVTLAAELPCRRLSGNKGSWILSMRCHDLVAGLAGERAVVGDGFGSGDLRVAARAGFWNLRGRRVVRVVAAYTRFEGTVETLDDLREAGGPGRQIGMTVQTSLTPLSRDDWCLSFVVVGVLGGRTMAHFTRECAVVGGALGLALGVMALYADLPTAVLEPSASNRRHRVGPVVTHLAERLGNESDPGDDQCRDGDD